MRLILVRHGQTDWNREGRIQGQNHGPLNSRGLSQVRALAAALQTEGVKAVYASPLVRGMETALAIGELCGVTATPLEGLKEMDVGELDGITTAQMRERYPQFSEQWRRNPAAAPMPGGESLAQVQERAATAVEELLKRHRGETVVAVSHLFTIWSLLCWAMEMPLASHRCFRVDLASKSLLEFWQQGPVLVCLNDRCHLEGL